MAVGATGAAGDGGTAALVAAAALLLVAAIAWERRSAEPLFPRGMFRPSTVLGGGVVFVFFVSFGTVGTAIYAPYFLQALQGVAPLVTGYVVTAQSLCWTVAALAVAGLAGRSAKLAIAAGPLITGAGCIGAALFLPGGPLAGAIGAIMLIGFGIGTTWGHAAKRIFDDAGEADRDRVTSVIPTTQSLGFAFGSAAAGIVADRVGLAGTPDPAVTAEAARMVYLALLPAIGLAFVGALRCAFGK
jgi:hypothetical protein